MNKYIVINTFLAILITITLGINMYFRNHNKYKLYKKKLDILNIISAVLIIIALIIGFMFGIKMDT